MKLTDAEKKARKLRANKASAIRRKMKLGKAITDNDKSFLSEWDASKSSKAASPPKKDPAKKEPIKKESSPVADPASVISSVVDSLKEPLTTSLPNGPGKPPPDPIPEQPRSAKDWQKKYDIFNGENRESECTALAQYWAKGLKWLNKDITRLEGSPLVSDTLIDAVLLPAMVLTVDKFAPKDMTLPPEMVSCIGSTIIAGQRVYVGRTAKKIEEQEENATVLSFVQPPTKPKDENDKKEPTSKPVTKSGSSGGPPIEDHDFDTIDASGNLPPC